MSHSGNISNIVARVQDVYLMPQ